MKVVVKKGTDHCNSHTFESCSRFTVCPGYRLPEYLPWFKAVSFGKCPGSVPAIFNHASTLSLHMFPTHSSSLLSV